MNNKQLADRLQRFALEVVLLSRSFSYFPDTSIIRRQLIKSVTSAAANYRAARCGRSRKEWYAKLCISIEEMDETQFWLQLATQLDYLSEDAINDSIQEAVVLTKILAKIRSSAKKNGV
ncbi:MAG TPA: four helix bundle protein [Saprospiraceae bacterium]|nr:four helix bundle protein [Saprospiraceae bacterium]